MSKKTTKNSKKRFKKFFSRIIVLLFIAMGLIALGPTFVNWGLGQGILKSTLEKSVNGTVEFSKLDLGWFGPQEINGLSIVNSNGEKTVDLDIQISAGLYGLLVSDVQHLEIDITGNIKGTLREDGSTSFHEILKQDKQKDVKASESEQSQPLEGLGRTTIRFNQIKIELNGEGMDAASSLTISDLSGKLAYVPGGQITINAQGKTKSSGQTGSLSIEGTIDNLVNQNGVLSLDKTSAKIDAELANIILPFSNQRTQLQSASLHIETDNLAKRVDLTFVVAASIESAEAGTLEGQLSAANIVGSDGSIDISLDKITGQINGKAVPASLVQFALEGTPILVSRDLGPTVDITASFSESSNKDINIAITSKQFNAQIAAKVNSNDRSLKGNKFHITWMVHPELLKEIAGIEVDKPMPVALDITEFSLPPVEPNQPLNLSALAVKGIIQSNQLRTYTLPTSGLGPVEIENYYITFDTPQLNQGLRLQLRTGESNAEVKVAIRSNVLHIEKAHAALQITPKLVAALQQDSADPVVLTEPTVVTIDLVPFDLVINADSGKYELPSAPIVASLSATQTTIANLPSTTEPIRIRQFKATIKANEAEQVYEVKGSATLLRSTSAQSLAQLDCELKVSKSDDAWKPIGTIALKGLELGNLEPAIGIDQGTLSNWLGDKGNVIVTVSSEKSGIATTLNANFPYLSGEFDATLIDEVVTISSDSAMLTLKKAAIESALNPKPADNKTAETQRIFTVAADVPLSLKTKIIRFPLEMLQGKPFDSDAVALDLTLTGGPLAMTDSKGNQSGINNMIINVTCDDIAKNIAFTITEEKSQGSTSIGEIALNGKLTNLVNAQKILQFDKRKISVDGEVSDMPTHVADAMLGLDGLLVAGVGPIMNSTFSSSDFSPYSGSLQGQLTTTNSSLKGNITGRDNGIIIAKASPVLAELQITPPLSQRLLAKIHPVLADIRSTEQPIRLSVSSAVLPLDQNMSRLNADIEITIGKVEFDSGSVTLGLLTFLNSSNAKTIPGYIEPVIANIKNGVVTYKRFVVVINKISMAYSGTIDLNTQMVDLHTELPISALALSIKELDGYVDDLIVPLVTRGKFDNLKTELDPEYDLLGATLKGGIRGILNKELKNKGLKDLLGNILDKIDK